MYELILDHTLGCSRVKTQNFLMMCLMKRDNEFRLGGDMVRNSSYLPFLLHLVIYDFFWPCSAPWLVMWLVWAPIFIPLISFISFCWGVVIRRQNKSEKIFQENWSEFLLVRYCAQLEHSCHLFPHCHSKASTNLHFKPFLSDVNQGLLTGKFAFHYFVFVYFDWNSRNDLSSCNIFPPFVLY